MTKRLKLAFAWRRSRTTDVVSGSNDVNVILSDASHDDMTYDSLFVLHFTNVPQHHVM